MNIDMINFKEKFSLDELTVCESEFWVWSVRKVQPTIGSGVLSLKRHAYSLSEITKKESEDLVNLVSIIENTMKKTFGFEIMNYLMLMMVDKHVHYHIIPRYSETKTFLGREWKDSGWPAIPNLNAEVEEMSVLLNIKKNLRLICRIHDAIKRYQTDGSGSKLTFEMYS